MTPKATKRRKVKKTPAKVSRTRKPDKMSVEEWQIALRRQFGQEQNFSYKNLDEEPIFSTFSVHNPASGGTYRVAIRSNGVGDNFCTCPDFKVNTLGTCKHIEWLLAKLARKRGGKKAFREGYHPPFSEVYLRYGAERSVHLSRGADRPEDASKLFDKYFDGDGRLREKGFKTFERFVRQASKLDHDIRVYDDVLGFVAQHRDNERRRDRIAERYEGKGSAATFKKLLRVKLYPYQRTGALFAAKAGRCLIADDMGLGKTFQAIAAVEKVTDATPAGKKGGLEQYVKQNEKTGAPELQIPLPDPDTAQKLGQLLGGLGEVLKGMGNRK